MYWFVMVCWVSWLAGPSRALLLGLLFLQSTLVELDDWWLCHSHGMARLISMAVSDPQRPSFHEATSYTRVAWHPTPGWSLELQYLGLRGLTLGAQVGAARFLWPCLKSLQCCFLHFPVERASHKNSSGHRNRTRWSVSTVKGQLE